MAGPVGQIICLKRMLQTQSEVEWSAEGVVPRKENLGKVTRTVRFPDD